MNLKFQRLIEGYSYLGLFLYFIINSSELEKRKIEVDNYTEIN